MLTFDEAAGIELVCDVSDECVLEHAGRASRAKVTTTQGRTDLARMPLRYVTKLASACADQASLARARAARRRPSRPSMTSRRSAEFSSRSR